MTTTGTNLDDMSSTDNDTDDGGGKLPPSENVLARHHQNLARQVEVEEVVLVGTSIPSLPVCGSLASCRGGTGCSPGSACTGVPTRGVVHAAGRGGVPTAAGRGGVSAPPPGRGGVPTAAGRGGVPAPAAGRGGVPAPAAGRGGRGVAPAAGRGGVPAARGGRAVPPVARARVVAGRRVPAKKRATNYTMDETLKQSMNSMLTTALTALATVFANRNNH